MAGERKPPRPQPASPTETTPVGNRELDVLRSTGQEQPNGHELVGSDDVVVVGIESRPGSPAVTSRYAAAAPRDDQREDNGEVGISTDAFLRAVTVDGMQSASDPLAEEQIEQAAASEDVGEQPTDETPAEEAPSDEAPAEEAPAEEAASEEAPAEELTGAERTEQFAEMAAADEGNAGASADDPDASGAPAPPEPTEDDLATPVLTDTGKRGPLSGAQWKLFDIGDLLGEGGMAAVYLARHRASGRLVALKVMPNRLADDEAFKRRFQLEAQTAGRLESPHVVRIYSAGNYSAMLYLEMEYVRGRSLGDIVRDKKKVGERFTIEQAVDYVLQSARALSEAARHNIVHRDIKPGNLMLTDDGRIKLTDFGIVKVMGEESLTMEGTAVGTPAYMSPEQGRGDAVDHRADLYSLGCVFYELLGMQQPFDGNTADALIYQHHFTEPKLVSELNSEITDDVQAVVFKCLQKDPDKRYQSAEELIADLEALRIGGPPTTAIFSGKINTGAEAMLRKHGAGLKRRWWPWALAAALTLGLGAGGWAYWDSRQADIRALGERLAVLDQPTAIPAGAGEDLARLAARVGATPEVERWRAKLDRVGGLEAELTGLDQLDHIDFAGVEKANAAARTYAELVGADAPAARHWRDRLSEVARAREAARSEAAALDAVEFAPISLASTLAPSVDRFARLSRPNDGDVERWRGKLAASQARVAELRSRLAALDQGAVAPAPVVESLAPDLAKLAALAGEEDAEVARWNDRSRASSARIGELRANLARFDDADLVADATRAALAADWADYQVLSTEGDAFRRRWSDRLAATDATRVEIRDALAVLDAAEPPTVDKHDPLAHDLGQYQAIAGASDPDALRWAAALAERIGRVAALKQVLGDFANRQDQLSAEELRLLKGSISELERVHGLDQGQADRFRATLARADAKLLGLRESLAVLDRAASPPPDVAARLADYERLAGVDDEQAARWRKKTDEIGDLHARLATLDHAQALPDGADEHLARLAELIGRGDPEVARWADKIAAVAGEKAALAGLDEQRTPPADATDRLARLTALVGADEPTVRRWSTKLERIDTLAQGFTALDSTYVLPDGIAERMTELVALVGADDPRAHHAAARIRVLTGVGKPTWADDVGRDAHGPYADVDIGKRFGILARPQRFRWVPAGSFVRGSPTSEHGRDPDERPVPVTLSHSIWMADCEVSQGMWATVMNNNPSYSKGERLPVDRVSWQDARDFTVQVSTRLRGSRARLPSEAEWEYACRAGAKEPFGREGLDASAIYAATAGGQSRPVKSRAANSLGLYDMHGNVWEWCLDGYGPYGAAASVDPVAGAADLRVTRGGSWGDDSPAVRAANRAPLAPTVRSAYVGFRIVIDAGGD